MPPIRIETFARRRLRPCSDWCVPTTLATDAPPLHRCTANRAPDEGSIIVEQSKGSRWKTTVGKAGTIWNLAEQETTADHGRTSREQRSGPKSARPCPRVRRDEYPQCRRTVLRRTCRRAKASAAATRRDRSSGPLTKSGLKPTRVRSPRSSQST